MKHTAFQSITSQKTQSARVCRGSLAIHDIHSFTHAITLVVVVAVVVMALLTFIYTLESGAALIHSQLGAISCIHQNMQHFLPCSVMCSECYTFVRASMHV